jgi:predicted RNA-binding protein YlxR (DUF448 family)/ribosomal protein L7Ae-like RNA K-turn-binding protein
MPDRTCVACRRESEQGMLIRFAAGPDGRLVVDHPPKLKGRGAYLCPDRACVEGAARRNPFPRAFRRPVTLPEGDLAAAIGGRVAGHVAGLLGVATRAGRTRSGATQVEEALERGRLALLLVATDAEPSTVAAFEARGRAAGVPVARYGTRETLGRAVGKEFRAVVGIADRGLAARIRDDLGALARLEAVAPAAGADGTSASPPPRERSG